MTTQIFRVAPSRDSITEQLGAEVAFNSSLSLSIGYDGIQSNHQSDNAVTMQVTWQF